MSRLATPLVLSAVAFAGLSFAPITLFDVETSPVDQTSLAIETTTTATSAEPVKKITDTRPIINHVPLPTPVRAIYMTSCVAGTPSFRQKLVELVKETEVNSIMIDIKDYSGTISFPPRAEAWKSAWQAAECGTPSMKELIEMLHDNDIYVIGRITVFQDPFYAPQHPAEAVLRSDQKTVWTDHKGLSFVDVASKTYWDHIIELSADAYNIGFDELNFDYVRYPSDGNMIDTYYPRSVAGEHGMDRQANLESFFVYLAEELANENHYSDFRHQNTGRATATPYTSADLFGMTTTNFDDLSIGQIQERAAPYFDFIAPMVYPSHYTDGFLGGRNPNEYPYEVVYRAMSGGVARMVASTTAVRGFLHERIGTSTPVRYQKPAYTADKFRTWIQDFDYGGVYDAADVRAQIQASYDAGVDSWMIWAPSNIYTKSALKTASTTSLTSVIE